MLNKVFNSNNPFWQSMGTIFDLFLVNTLWLICCLPIFTIGPATTAAYYTIIERLLGQGGYISYDFKRSFKKNFKQGVKLGVPVTLVGAFLALDVYLCRISGTGIFTFFMVFFAILFVFWCFTVLYTFPILSKFDMKNRDILIWAFTLSLKNLSMTLTMFFMTIVSVWLCHLIPGLIFIMFGICAQFNATIIVAMLKDKLVIKFEDEYDDSDDDNHFGPQGPDGTHNSNDYFCEDLL